MNFVDENKKDKKSAIWIFIAYIWATILLSGVSAYIDKVDPFASLNYLLVLIILVIIGVFSIKLGLKLKNNKSKIGLILIIIGVMSFPPISIITSHIIANIIFIPIMNHDNTLNYPIIIK